MSGLPARLQGAWIVAAIALPLALFASPAAADSVTFLFNYADFPPHSAPYNLTPGSFGTITLTDSLVDPNRVDVDLVAIPHPAYAAGLFEQFYLNFNHAAATNHSIFAVPQDTPPGPDNDPTPYQGQTNGTALYSNSNFSFANFQFDIRVLPDSDALIYAGSLGFYNDLTDDPVDLNVSDFIKFSSDTGSPGVPQAYSGWRLHNFDPGPPFDDGEFWAFSNEIVPEPSSVLTFGLGAVGLCAWGLRKVVRRSRRKS